MLDARTSPSFLYAVPYEVLERCIRSGSSKFKTTVDVFGVAGYRPYSWLVTVDFVVFDILVWTAMDD